MAGPPPGAQGIPVVDPELPLPPAELISSLSPQALKFKNTLCTSVSKGGPCSYAAKCHFAHTEWELRAYGYGPTPEEAVHAGLRLPPALVAWWKQQRRELALKRADAAKPRRQPLSQQVLPPDMAATGSPNTDEELRKLQVQFSDEFKQQQQWDQQHPEWQATRQRAASANGALVTAAEGHAQPVYRAPAVAAPPAVPEPAMAPSGYQAEPSLRHYTQQGLQQLPPQTPQQQVQPQQPQMPRQVGIQPAPVVQLNPSMQQQTRQRVASVTPAAPTPADQPQVHISDETKAVACTLDVLAEELTGLHAQLSSQAVLVSDRMLEVLTQRVTHAKELVKSRASELSAFINQLNDKGLTAEGRAALETAVNHVKGQFDYLAPHSKAMLKKWKEVSEATGRGPTAQVRPASIPARPPAPPQQPSQPPCTQPVVPQQVRVLHAQATPVPSVPSNAAAAHVATPCPAPAAAQVPQAPAQAQLAVTVGQSQVGPAPVQPHKPQVAAAPVKHQPVAINLEPASVMPTVIKPHAHVITTVPAAAAAPVKPAKVPPAAQVTPQQGAQQPKQQLAQVQGHVQQEQAVQKQEPVQKRQQQPVQRLEPVQKQVQQSVQKQEPAQKQPQQPVQKQQQQQPPVQKQVPTQKQEQPRPVQKQEPAQQQKQQTAQKQAPARVNHEQPGAAPKTGKAAASASPAAAKASASAQPEPTHAKGNDGPQLAITASAAKAVAKPAGKSIQISKELRVRVDKWNGVISLLHKGWADLYRPFFTPYVQGEELLTRLQTAVESVEAREQYMRLQAAVRYYINRQEQPAYKYNTQDKEVSNYVKEALGEDYLMDDVDNWRALLGPPSSNAGSGSMEEQVKSGCTQYLCKLIQLIAYADADALMRRLDTYMNEYYKHCRMPDYLWKPGHETVMHLDTDDKKQGFARRWWYWVQLDKGDRRVAVRGDRTGVQDETGNTRQPSLMFYVINQRKTAILRFALEVDSPTTVFTSEVHKSLNPLSGSTNPMTGLLHWAKKHGSDLEALQVLLKAVCDRKMLSGSRSDEVLLITNMISDTATGFQHQLIMQAMEAFKLSVQGRNPKYPLPWSYEVNAGKGVDCSFLHLVLASAAPDNCWPLVQFSVNKCLKELKSEPEADRPRFMGMFVRDKYDTSRGKMSPLELALFRSPPLPHIKEIVQLLLEHGADPIADPNHQQVVTSTPMHNVVTFVEQGVLGVNDGAELLGMLVSKCPVEDADRVVASGHGCPCVNVLGYAAMSTRAPVQLVTAILKNCAMDVVRLQSRMLPAVKGIKSKEFCTALSLALVSEGRDKDVNRAVARALITARPWDPLQLLAALGVQQPPAHLEAVAAFAAENRDIMLEPLQNMSDEELTPLKKASLEPGRSQLLHLLLEYVPNLKHDCISLWKVQSAGLLKRMVDRGARIRLVQVTDKEKADKFEERTQERRNFKQKKLQELIQQMFVGWSSSSSDANYLVKGLLWEEMTVEQWDRCLDKTGRLLALLRAQDEDEEYFADYIEGVKLSIASLFGMGIGSLNEVAQILEILLKYKCVDPNERDPKRCGMTLLHLASLDGAVESVEVLIKYGAAADAVIEPRDPNAEAPTPDTIGLHDSLVGYTALHLVVKQFTKAFAQCSTAPAHQLLDMPGPCFKAPDCVVASGYRVLSVLLQQDPSRLAGLTAQPEPGAKGKNAKGKTPRQLMGTAAHTQPLRDMYDEAYRAAHEIYKSRNVIVTPVGGGDEAAKAKEKAEKAAKEKSAKEAAHVPAPVKVDSETLLMQAVMAVPRSEDAVPLDFMVKSWANVKPQRQENVLHQLVKVMVDDRQIEGPGAAGQGSTTEADEAQDKQAATQAALQKQVFGMFPEHEGWKPEDDRAFENQEPYDSSSDEEVDVRVSTPVPSTGSRTTVLTPNGKTPVKDSGPQQQAAAVLDPASFLQELEWMFTITKEARQSWASLPNFAKELVLKRLRDMGRGMWASSGGVKRFKTERDDKLKGLDLWRIKITKGGRILFEIAVEYSEELRCWSECIRLWCITMNHKKYEEAITAVQDSYKRSQAVRERRKLQIMEGDDSSAHTANPADTSSQGVRHPKRFMEINADLTLPSLALGAPAQQPVKNATETAAAKTGQQQQQRGMELREHLPPATYDPEQFTLLKVYNVDVVLLQSVLQGLTDAQVDLPFKLSPAEWEIITRSPNPPASILLLGRSGTGKTTCAVYRIWSKWLSGYKEWIPGARAMAAAAAADAARAVGDVTGMDALAERAARMIGGATVFVTASATLCATVKRAFRKMQMAAMQPDEFRTVEAAGRVVYPTFVDVPPEAFPMFLTSRQYLEMVDATTKNPFFRRRADGTIIKVRTASEEDRDSAEVVIDLAFDEEQDGDFGDEEGAGANLEEEDEEDEVKTASAVDAADMEEKEDDTAAGLAGQLSVAKEVTWIYFLNEMWPKITTPEQRKRLKPALVWAEICSYIKGSAEAICTRQGYLDKDAYVDLGARRAANFSKEMREHEIYPIFKKYQKLRAQERRYDIMDFVSHVYGQLVQDGYQGVRIDSLYRDEVQDFTQAELALDLRVVSDPNALFYCGDTAQTIARGVGFRFEDIKVLLYQEGQQRQALAREREKREVAKVSMPGIEQLTTNYRTHQGILNTAAVVVDLLRLYYPNSIDKLERERALFDGPGPILLSGTQETDLTYLLSGSDRANSQVEFGANQVILVRSMAAADQLPTEIRNSNALVMTVQQAKGLEFDDVFLVDFFANSPAPASEWRVLNYFVEQLKDQVLQLGAKERKTHKHQELLNRYEQYSKCVAALGKEEEGHLRPVQLEPTEHVLLQEELKHLYTAITRAKSNVVVFDRSPERRAPFYNLLRCLGMARIVNKSLLEDGSDAVVYGLSQRANNSQEEWFKRAKSLMERGSPGLAASAFRQAGDLVRAEIAYARHLRLEAAGAAYQDQSMQQKVLSREEKRRMLYDVAFRCLGAARHRDEAPNKVTEKEHFRWIRLAAQCLTEVGDTSLAAQLQALTHNYKSARELLLRLIAAQNAFGAQNTLAAQNASAAQGALGAVCARAYHYYTAETKAAQARAAKLRSSLVISGTQLAEALSGGLVGQDRQAAVALAEEDARDAEQRAVKAQRLAKLYMARAIHAYYKAGDHPTWIRLLHEHSVEVGMALQRIWPSMADDLVKGAWACQNLGQIDVALQALQLAPNSREKEEFYVRCECERVVWDELVTQRRKQGDFMGAAQVLMSQRQHAQAANILLELMGARSDRVLRPYLESAGLEEHDEALERAASQPVPTAAFSMLATCILALRTPADACSLLPKLEAASVAAEEAKAQAELQFATAHAHVVAEVLAADSMESAVQTNAPQLLQSAGQENWLAKLELSYSKELPCLTPPQTGQAAGVGAAQQASAKAAHVLSHVLSSPSVHAADSIATTSSSVAANGAGPSTSGMQEILATCAQWLDNGLTVLEGLQQLLELRTPAKNQQALLEQFEQHYGLSSRTPMAVNLLAVGDPSPVYLGDASYVWSGITQPSAKDNAQGASQLPEHAPRPPIAHTLAWDLWRKLHLVASAAVLRCIHVYMSALRSPQHLNSVAAATEHVVPLLTSLLLLQRLDSLHKLRMRVLTQPGALSGKQRRGAAAVSFPDSALPVAISALQQAHEFRIMADYQQRVVIALVCTSGLLPAHVHDLCSKMITNFGQDLLESAAGMTLREFELNTLRVFDAAYPYHANWQGANLGCWWSLTMLAQKPALAMSRICQKHTPPGGVDRSLFLGGLNKAFALPEEMLARATERMELAEPVIAVPDMLKYVMHSVLKLKSSSSGTNPNPHLALEPCLLVLEVLTCTLTLGVADGPTQGNKELQGPRAYVPTACLDLLYHMPHWGLQQGKHYPQNLNNQLELWLKSASMEHTHQMVGKLLAVLRDFIDLLAKLGPALSTMPQHQMLALCASYACQRVSVPTVACLDVPAQRMRAALLAVRLARVLSCMLLTLEVSRATWAAAGGLRGVCNSSQVCSDLRKVLQGLLPVLRNAPASSSQAQPSTANVFEQHAQNFAKVLNASKLGELMAAVAALAQDGLQEVTLKATRDCTTYVSAAWTQLLNGSMAAGTSKSQARKASGGSVQSSSGKRGAGADLLSLNELGMHGNKQSEKEQQQKAARVIQQHWRSWAAVRAAARQKAEQDHLNQMVTRRLVLLKFLRPDIRLALANYKLHLKTVLGDRKFMREQEERLAMQAAARKSGLLGNIQEHRNALAGTDNYLSMSGLTLTRCPVCPKAAVQTQQQQQVGAPLGQAKPALSQALSQMLDQHARAVGELGLQAKAVADQQKQSAEFQLRALLPELQVVEQQLKHGGHRESAEYQELRQHHAKVVDAVSKELQQLQRACLQQTQLAGNARELPQHVVALRSALQQLLADVTSTHGTAAAAAAAPVAAAPSTQPRSIDGNVWRTGTSQQVLAPPTSRRPEAPSFGPSPRLFASALRPCAPTFVVHAEDPGHKKVADEYRNFHTVYLEIMCSCLWWAEITRLAADKAIQSLVLKQEEQQADAPQPENADAVAKQKLASSLAGMKADLDFSVDRVRQQVRSVLQQRNWCDAARNMQQQAVDLLRHVVSTVKELLQAGGQGETLLAIIKAGREAPSSGGVNVLYEPADKAQKKEEGQAVRAGKLPPALCKLAVSLLGEPEANNLLGIAAEQPKTAMQAGPQAADVNGPATPAGKAEGERSLLEDAAYANALGQTLLDAKLMLDEDEDEEEEEPEEEDERDEEDDWVQMGKRGKIVHKAGRMANGGGGARNKNRTPQAARPGRR